VPADQLPIPKEIDKSAFEGPDKVADEFNKVMSKKIENVIPENEIEQVLYVIEGDIDRKTKVKELPARYMFSSFARHLNQNWISKSGEKYIDGQINASTAKNWFVFIKRYYIDQSIDELEPDIEKAVDNGKTSLNGRSYTGAENNWTLDEISKIIEVEKQRGNRSDVYAGIWLMCFTHGRRIGEVLDVKWSDVDDGGITYNIEKKDEKTRATLPLYEPIAEQLMEIGKTEGIDYVFHGFKHEDGSMIPANKPLSQRSVRNRLDGTTEMASGVEQSTHTKRFRHSIATIVTEEHGPKAAQNLLKHANPEITLRVYARHIKESDHEEVKDIWGEKL
jgi:site-specific recombinase XerD